MANVTSTEIKLALADVAANQKAYFLTECKTCSTYFPDPQGMLKFDGLSIRRSYTKPCITGYEIKVSRGDFLQDPKWHLYLQYCNEFYFVVPSGLIDKSEIPPEVGLIYYNPENKTLRTKRKALYREIEEPVGVYKYIIYSRLETDRTPFYEQRAEYAKDYLEDKAQKRCIGTVLGSKMAKELQQCYERLENLKYTEERMDLYKAIMQVLEKHNIAWSWDKDAEKVTKSLDQALSSAYPKELEYVERHLKIAYDNLLEIRAKNEEDQDEHKTD